MSENNDELPLSRWFGTDTTNTTLEDMQKLFNRFDTCCLTLTYRNNGVEVVQSAVVDTFRNRLPAYMVAEFEEAAYKLEVGKYGIGSHEILDGS